MKKYAIYIDYDGLYEFIDYDKFVGEEEHIFHAETHDEAEIYFFRWLLENGH